MLFRSARERLARCGGDTAALGRLWSSLERKVREEPEVEYAYARALLDANAHPMAEEVLRKALARQWAPPLVALCDISGSMSRYSRLFLHFLHAVTNDRDRVYSFVFGTRLTNVTRDLRQKDVDVALARVAQHVEDWSGGTRIGATLHEFNTRWSRRVLGQGAVVQIGRAHV